MTRMSFLLSILTALLVTTGCGRDRGPSGPIGPTGGSALITAAEGGTVDIADSETRLSIPANALTVDTEIVLSVESPAGYPTDPDLREVIAMSPQGTVLSTPASLSWQPSGAGLTGSETVSLVQLVDGGWSIVDTSVSIGSGGIVSAQVSRLETYGLRVTTPVVGAGGNIAGMVRHIYTEDPLPGIGITLYDRFENEMGTAVSGSDGSFGFAELPAGEYFLVADVPPEDNCFSDPTTKDATVTEGGTVDVFFGFVPGPC